MSKRTTGGKTKPRPSQRGGKKAPPPRKRKRKGGLLGIPPFGALLGVVIVAGIAAIVFTRPSTNTGSGLPTTAPVDVKGAALPGYQGSGNDSGVGMPAPQVTGTDFSRNPVSITNDGKPKAIVFLAHWCPHCRNEVPRVQSWIDSKGMPKDVNLFTVSTWADATKPNWPPGDWLRDEGWTMPTLVDDGSSSVGNAYGLKETPMWVFVGKEGKVLLRVTGEIETSELEKILAQTARS